MTSATTGCTGSRSNAGSGRRTFSPCRSSWRAVGRAPPEDSGGPWGFATLKEAIADPGHEDHEHFLEWHGPFDPSDIREAEIRARIARIRNYLNAAARKARRPGQKSG